MKKIFLITLCCLCFSLTKAQTLKAYQIYNKAGQPVNFGQMINSLSQYDVVLFGEYHNNAIIHWLELQTEKALYQHKGNKLVLGAEMFERDNQEALDKYLSGKIDDKQLQEEARLWPNYKTDYRPLVDFAKKHDLNFIATNIPRRYAQYVARKGLDTLLHLSKKEEKYMAHMPITVDMATPGYSEMVAILKKHTSGDKLHNFIAAQAVKDATMAASILTVEKKGFLFFKKKRLFLHFNGNYHSKKYGGIYWYLKKHKKRLKVAVITTAQAKSNQLPLPSKDYVPTEFTIVVPADMTKTY